jgi:hypothetical protein
LTTTPDHNEAGQRQTKADKEEAEPRPATVTDNVHVLCKQRVGEFSTLHLGLNDSG